MEAEGQVQAGSILRTESESCMRLLDLALVEIPILEQSLARVENLERRETVKEKYSSLIFACGS